MDKMRGPASSYVRIRLTYHLSLKTVVLVYNCMTLSDNKYDPSIDESIS